jgi:hypothetical protein
MKQTHQKIGAPLKSGFALSLLLLYLSSPIAVAQSPGTFTPAGNMTTARYGHTATLLTDGRVLIAGGFGSGGIGMDHHFESSAELYDPSTGTFTPTGSMTTGRYWAWATLLPDGRVFIAGGTRPDLYLASAEIYNPSAGTFSTVASMPAATYFTATLLPNGKVLTLFWLADPTGWRAGLYDPATQAFSVTANGPGGDFQNATLLADGRVFFDRGTDLNGIYIDGQLYDPSTSTSTPVADTLTADTRDCCGFWNTATVLTNGNVLLAGAGNGDAGVAFDSAALYDRARGALIPVSSMTARRIGHKAALLPDGKVLITGGASGCPPQGGDCTGVNSSAEIYDPSTGAFRPAGNMTTVRILHTATLLTDGTVLIAGGPFTAGAEIYHPLVLTPPPALVSLSGDGQGQGAILHAGTPELASSSNPAAAGEALEIYGMGLMDGSVLPPQVTIGGRLAEILFFGKAPGIAGLNQVNVRVPVGVAPGPAVPVRLTYLSRPSNVVTIGLR